MTRLPPFSSAPADSNFLSSIHFLLACSLHHPKPKHRHKSRSLPSKRHQHRTLPSLYLKPGALARLRDAQRSARSSPACPSKKRFDHAEDAEVAHLRAAGEVSGPLVNAGVGPTTPGPSVRVFGPVCPQRKKLLAPKASLSAGIDVPNDRPSLATAIAPTVAAGDYLLESLSLELLVRIVCYLHHDQLKAVFHVSKKFRQAVMIARECHFDFMTPDRGQPKREQLSTFESGILPFARDYEIGLRPSTPKAPRPAQKPLQARISLGDMQHLAVPLFHGSVNRAKPPSPPHAAFRTVASHRALFYEEELCQAVAQNSI